LLWVVLSCIEFAAAVHCCACVLSFQSFHAQFYIMCCLARSFTFVFLSGKPWCVI
jgi:hypothetical protein